jgi:hypothetical protein
MLVVLNSLLSGQPKVIAEHQHLSNARPDRRKTYSASAQLVYCFFSTPAVLLIMTQLTVLSVAMQAMVCAFRVRL